jgi:hypothetical protein
MAAEITSGSQTTEFGELTRPRMSGDGGAGGWILESGSWDDGKPWDDTATWNDGV